MRFSWTSAPTHKEASQHFKRGDPLNISPLTKDLSTINALVAKTHALGEEEGCQPSNLLISLTCSGERIFGSNRDEFRFYLKLIKAQFGDVALQLKAKVQDFVASLYPGIQLSTGALL